MTRKKEGWRRVSRSSRLRRYSIRHEGGNKFSAFTWRVFFFLDFFFLERGNLRRKWLRLWLSNLIYICLDE